MTLKALRQRHPSQTDPSLPTGFLAPTLFHFGLESDEARAKLARRLAHLKGYMAAEPLRAPADAAVSDGAVAPHASGRQALPDTPE